MNKIVIITSGQPSANPRVVKEATALASNGKDVTVLYVPLSPWADHFDVELFASTPFIKWLRVGYHPLQQKSLFKLLRIRRKFYEWANNYFPFVKTAEEYSYILFAQELEKAALKIKADLYIAHNLGAIRAAVKAAKKWNTKCAFDAEDFHRGENVPGSNQSIKATFIEEKYFPQLAYLTTASPLITRKYKQLFPALKVHTINNVFSKKFIPLTGKTNNDKLSLFWFSQTIGPKRGLENVIKAINFLQGFNIELHLLGDCSPAYKKTLVALTKEKEKLFFYAPVALAEIFKIASNFDIGLASEIPDCENRDICLTNKLFTYILSGNCIFASDTKAQIEFMAKYPGVGEIYKHNDPIDLSNKIRAYYENKSLLHKAKEYSMLLGETELNWEIESQKLLSIVNPPISDFEKNSHYIPSFSPV